MGFNRYDFILKFYHLVKILFLVDNIGKDTTAVRIYCKHYVLWGTFANFMEYFDGKHTKQEVWL